MRGIVLKVKALKFPVEFRGYILKKVSWNLVTIY